MSTRKTSTDKLLSLIKSKKSPDISSKDQDSPTSTPGGKNISKVASSKNSFWSRGISLDFSRRQTVGVDIRKNSVLLVKMTAGKPHRLLDLRQIPNEEGLSKDDPQFPDFLRQCLKDIGCTSTSTDIWSLVSLKDTDFWHIQLPKVPNSALYDAVFWAVKKEKQFDENKYLLDFEVQGERYEDKTVKYDVMAFIVPHDVINFQKHLFKKAGYQLKGLTLSPYATQSIFRSGWHEPGAKTFATLYVGHEWSRMDVYSGGNLLLNRGIKSGTANMVTAFLESGKKQGQPQADLSQTRFTEPSGENEAASPPQFPTPARPEETGSPPEPTPDVPTITSEEEPDAALSEAPAGQVVSDSRPQTSQDETSTAPVEDEIEFTLEMPAAPTAPPSPNDSPQGDIEFSFSLEEEREDASPREKDKTASLAMKEFHVADDVEMDFEQETSAEPDPISEKIRETEEPEKPEESESPAASVGQVVEMDLDAVDVEIVDVEADAIEIFPGISSSPADGEQLPHLDSPEQESVSGPDPTPEAGHDLTMRTEQMDSTPSTPSYAEDIPDFLSQDDVIELMGRASEPTSFETSRSMPQAERHIPKSDAPAAPEEDVPPETADDLDVELDLDVVPDIDVDLDVGLDLDEGPDLDIGFEPSAPPHDTSSLDEPTPRPSMEIEPDFQHDSQKESEILPDASGPQFPREPDVPQSAPVSSEPDASPAEASPRESGAEESIPEESAPEESGPNDIISSDPAVTEERVSVGMNWEGEDPDAIEDQVEAEARAAMFCALGNDANDSSPEQALLRKKQAFASIRPSAERLARQVERTLDYSRSILGHDPAEKIYLSGDICLYDEFREFLQSELALDCQLLDPLGKATANSSLNIPKTFETRLRYNHAMALALCDDDYTPNLLNTFADRHRTRSKQRMTTSIISIFLATLIGLTGWYMWLEQMRQNKLAEFHQSQQELGNFKPRVTQNLLLRLATQIAATKRAVKAAGLRYEPLAVASEMAKITPPSVKLLSVDIRFATPTRKKADEQRPPASREAPPATGIVLTGFLTSREALFDTIMTEYLLTLKASPLFDAPRIIRREPAVTKSGDPIQRFAIGMRLAGTPAKEKSQ